jgi:hypothetical protein
VSNGDRAEQFLDRPVHHALRRQWPPRESPISTSEPAMHTEAMIRTHPAVNGRVDANLLRCIEECLDCAQTCTSCADACLGESNVSDLRRCIRLNLDCADLCTATAAIASRCTGSNDAVLKAVILACRDACNACAAECESHASMHEHCRVCAETCRRCEAACTTAAGGVRPSLQ